jgi:hypothetical protein
MVGILDNGAIYGDLIIFNGIYNDKHDNQEFGSMEINADERYLLIAKIWTNGD